MYFLLAALCFGAAIAQLSQQDDIRQSERALREEIRSQPDNFEANHLLGELYIKQNELNTAIPFLRQAYKVDSSNYDNAYDLALAYLETGDTENSKSVINALIGRQDKAELHNLLGDVEEKQGDAEQAAKQYEAAARMDPSEKNLFDLANELLLHRGFQPALKVLDFATQKYPQSARLRVGLGVAYYSLGQYQEALEALCHAVDLDPTDTRALDFLGKMYDVAPEKADEVTRRLAKFAREYPNNAAANYYYALSLRRRTTAGASASANQQAEKLLQTAVKLAPRWAEAHYELGLLYEDESKIDDAIREYHAAVQLRPQFAKAHYRLALLYKKKGQAQLARTEFQAFEQLKGKSE